MNIVITGGLGFIGFNYLLTSLDQKEITRIILVDKVTYASHYRLSEKLQKIEQNSGKVKLITSDINEIDFASLVSAEKIDTIINFAAESHVDNSISDSSPFLTANVDGINNILRGLVELQKTNTTTPTLIQISTDEVFGHLSETGKPFTENSPLAPRNPYSATKAAAELLLKSYKNTYGLESIILNCCNNYGPYQHPEKLIPKAITSMIIGEKIPIYGDGLNIREWIFVEDFCHGIQKVVMTKSARKDRYLFGSGIELSNLDLMENIFKHLQSKNLAFGSFNDSVRFVPDRLGHDRRYAVNSRLTQLDLKWSPETSLIDGINSTIQHFEAS